MDKILVAPIKYYKGPRQRHRNREKINNNAKVLVKCLKFYLKAGPKMFIQDSVYHYVKS